MRLLTGITPQEGFPQEDLSEDNAGLLCLILSNSDLVRSGHQQAEGTYLVYRVGHKALLGASGHLDNVSTEAMNALDQGITVYETMSTFVRFKPVSYSTFEVVTNGAFVTLASRADWFEYLEEAEAYFRQNLPNAREVVSEAVGRHHPTTVSYAHLGAALACQFEIDAANGTRAVAE